jgi:Cu(I)/Ag(I) efflux system membrane fusion protein
MDRHPGDAPEELPEGAEAAPPGVRTMGAVRWALVALMALAAAGSWVYVAGLAPAGSEAAAQFRCPMHPAVLQPRPGECPICGMDLVAVAAAEPAGAAAAAPPGPAASAPAASAPGRFWCPMHPEIASDDPEARCEKCGGMKLLPREPAAPQAGAAPPGLAPVTIESGRAQLGGVRTAAVERRRVGARLRAVGSVTVDERSVAIVATRFAGWIEELRVRETGVRVEKGQILATVYSPDLLAAQQTFLASRRLADPQVLALAPATQGFPVDASRRLDLLGVAKQDVEKIMRAGEVQGTIPIRAPASGWIARKAALEGVYVQPGLELFQIADLSTVWVIAEIHEGDAGAVRVGQRAEFLPAARGSAPASGEVRFVYPAVDPDRRTLQARIVLANPDLALRPGMSGDVLLEAAGADGPAVPRDALVDTGELQYVFVAREGGRFEPRVVRVGARDDEWVQVLAGVAEGERVVTTANFLVDAESRLRAAVETFGR